GERALLAADAIVDQAYREVGILEAPTFERFVETVDRAKVAHPDGEIARAHALPAASSELAQGTERGFLQRAGAVDVAADLRRMRLRVRPLMDGRAAGKHEAREGF